MNKRQRKKQAKKERELIKGPIKIRSGIKNGMLFMDFIYQVKMPSSWSCKVWGLE